MYIIVIHISVLFLFVLACHDWRLWVSTIVKLSIAEYQLLAFRRRRGAARGRVLSCRAAGYILLYYSYYFFTDRP